MQAVRAHEGGEVRFETVPDPVPSPGEVVVALRRAALNRRDLRIRGAEYPFPRPLVPGSDGAGVRRDTGEEVVILPSVRWGSGEAAPGPEFEILGGPSDGTFAELIAIPEENVFRRPARLSWEESAAFPLAGLTAYRALFVRGGLRAGETVLVLGAGSGVSTFAVQLAAQAGARVLVTTSSAAKLERAVALGADGGVLYTEGDWAAGVRELTGGRGPDLVVDSVGATLPDSLRAVADGGRVVVLGATRGDRVDLAVRPFFYSQVSLLATTMGSPRDFSGLLGMLAAAAWRPVVDSTRPLGEIDAALDRLEGFAHFGKLVLECD
jgi:NADPH:quinone reductase-like Zn-dependent oxidoreductase